MCTKLISPETWLLAYSATSLWNAGATYHTWWSPQKSPKSWIVFSKLECLSVRGHVLLLNHLKRLCFVHCLVFVKRQFSVCASRKFDIQINLKSQLWKAFQHYISKSTPSVTTIWLKESRWGKSCYFLPRADIYIQKCTLGQLCIGFWTADCFSRIFWSHLGSLVPGKGQSTSSRASGPDIEELRCTKCCCKFN